MKAKRFDKKLGSQAIVMIDKWQLRVVMLRLFSECGALIDAKISEAHYQVFPTHSPALDPRIEVFRNAAAREKKFRVLNEF